MTLEWTKQNWERFGRKDPLYAIVTDPAKAGKRWDVGEFFESGKADVAAQFEHLSQLGVDMARARALDFGCGVGRYTQALCQYFGECYGVDIATSMIQHARRLNQLGERCKFIVNEASNLSLFADGTFDFVFCILVLQHIPPTYAKQYVTEFIRVLRPGGVALFQAPATTLPIPLVPEGYHATITPVEALPSELPAATEAQLSVVVRNTGTVSWRQDSRIRVGHRWSRGDSFVSHQSRLIELPSELAPEDQVHVDVPVIVPLLPGRYSLELDLAQESVGWFADRGSTPTRQQIDVVLLPTSVGVLHHYIRPLRSLRRVARKMIPRPVMDMYCVPQEEIAEAVAAGGGKLRDVSRFDVCGDGYESYRYVAVRPAS